MSSMPENPEVVTKTAPPPMGMYADPIETDGGAAQSGIFEMLTRILTAYAPTIERLLAILLRGHMAKGCPNCNPPEGDGKHG